MYKDVLETLNNNRKVDKSFIERLEKNGFEVYYGKFNYWNGQEYIQIGKRRIWLVDTYPVDTGGISCGYKYRNKLVKEIKEAIEEEKIALKEETELINEVLPIR